MMRAPARKMCSSCGRRPHKVAVRIRRKTKYFGEQEDVRGYCPTCWRTTVQGMIDGSPIAPAPERVFVIYDRRGRSSSASRTAA